MQLTKTNGHITFNDEVENNLDTQVIYKDAMLQFRINSF